MITPKSLAWIVVLQIKTGKTRERAELGGKYEDLGLAMTSLRCQLYTQRETADRRAHVGLRGSAGLRVSLGSLAAWRRFLKSQDLL